MQVFISEHLRCRGTLNWAKVLALATLLLPVSASTVAIVCQRGRHHYPARGAPAPGGKASEQGRGRGGEGAFLGTHQHQPDGGRGRDSDQVQRGAVTHRSSVEHNAQHATPNCMLHGCRSRARFHLT
ncbi:hypothetical protein T492DRAFT_946915 [Pavlovales sp. CCMP2436]|nr:hypothetical protein T492DRAFT_946915 [Pavlovales sp. CCMP2436]